MNKYELLLKQWCDKLIELQITEIKDPNFFGGILCPACASIHGRIADAVYPFTLLYDRTGDEKYLNAAKLVIDWSEYNLSREDGSYYNDKCSGWKGISVFSATALGDALLYHGDCLDRETKEKWLGIFKRLAEFVYDFFDNKLKRTNVNYYATICPVMAFAYKLTGDEKYKEKAYQRFEWIKTQFTENGLLYGEGPDKQTPKGCKYVDLGYNVEESLPALATFAYLMEDEEALEFVAEKFKAHIEFMLPDGGWDNSWGTRSNKWTYWGSRTSDGAGTGLCYLTKFDDIFAEAMERNFNMLEQCSADGYLYGGPHYKEFGEDPCTHHSFCHAKALALMIDTGFEYKKSVSLPRDSEYGTKHFSGIGTDLISLGKFRATFTENDAIDYFKTALTGGSLTALWTKDTGMLFSSSAPSYNTAFAEPRNMQLSRKADEITNCTLRIEKGDFLSQNDCNAQIFINEDENKISVLSDGKLCNMNYEGETGFRMVYVFESNTLTFTAKCEEDAELIIPIVCTKKDIVTETQKGLTITKPQTTVTVESENGKLILPCGTNHRDISLIGGFMTLPVKAQLKANESFTFKITL